MTITEIANPRIPDLVPARMLNEYAYCPRLAYLEWVQGEFADSVDTIEGALPAPPGGPSIGKAARPLYPGRRR